MKRAINLIEVIFAMLVLAVVLPTLFILWQEVIIKLASNQITVNSLFYAQELMEEVLSKKYDENYTSPYSNILTSEENTTDKSIFDDIDDFNNYEDNIGEYKRQVKIGYVFLNNTTWQNCPLVSCQEIVNCSSCQECCFKKVEVKVSDKKNLKNITLQTIVSGN